MARKPSRGRQRIPMERIQNESSRQVAFSKRRSVIVKKCNELTTLTGAELAVVIFSPANKPFSFGVPAVETILNRFQNQENPNNDHLSERSHHQQEDDQSNNLDEKDDLLKEIHEVQRKLKQLNEEISVIEEKDYKLYLEDSVENLEEEQLVKLKDAFRQLYQNAEKMVNKQNNGTARGGHMATFADYANSGIGFNLLSQEANETGPATFGGGGSGVFQMNVPSSPGGDGDSDGNGY